MITAHSFLLSILLVLCACSSDNTAVDMREDTLLNKEGLTKVRLLGHKGSGDSPYGFENFIGNSLESVLHAMRSLDGSEIDLQLSKDHTLWLFHDHEIMGCDGKLVNFYDLTDSDVEQSSSCNYHSQLIRLSDLIEAFRGQFSEEKTLSLDLKLLRNPRLLASLDNTENASDTAIHKLSFLKNIKNLNLLIEVPAITFIEKFQSHGFEVYEVVSAEKENPSSDTYNYSYSLNSLENYNYDNVPGENIQIWTVNSFRQASEAINYKPDYIQGDNVGLLRFINALKSKPLEVIESEIIDNARSEGGKEYYMLEELSPSDFEDKVLVRITLGKVPEMNDDMLMVFSLKNNAGESVFWEGIEIEQGKKEYFKYIEKSTMKKNDSALWKIFVWNRKKSRFDFSSIRVDHLSIKK